MISPSPSPTSIFCCLDGVWQLVAYPSFQPRSEFLPPRSVRAMEAQIVALQVVNDNLRLETLRLAEQAQLQSAEADHRLKNTFTTILALARQTARPGDTGEVYRATFEARLLALARSHELLEGGYPTGVTLTELVKRCLQSYGKISGRATVSGPEVRLPAQDVPTLGLIFHELTTNAVKYGALSVPEGRVEVTWHLEADIAKESHSLVIVWRERGGPPVKAPKRCGFGSRLLERGFAHGSGSTAKIDFAPDGVDCRISLPLTSAILT